MRIAVLVILGKQQHSPITHELYDLFVSLKNSHAGKKFHVRSKATSAVYRAVDLQAVFLPDDKVVVTVSWCCMNAPGAGFA